MLLIASLLLSPSLVLAASPGGTGPDDTLAPGGDWTGLSAGQSHWYAFQYQVGQEEVLTDEDEEEDESPVITEGSSVRILLDAEPDQSISFSVWTSKQVGLWALGEEVDPVGQGTENEYTPGDLCWFGKFFEAGTYYVVVEHTGQGPDTAYYSLSISGDDVWFATPTAENVEPAHPAAVPEAVEPELVTGTSPGDAWTLLPVGETHWQEFQYTGHHEFVEADDEDEEEAVWIDTEVQVWLHADPDDGATFSIWTEDQVRVWVLGEEVEPVGQGTENEYAPGDLFWAGSLGSSGRYYIMVEHQGSEPTQFMLSISGQDVSP